jgi:hypothetical protein
VFTALISDKFSDPIEGLVPGISVDENLLGFSPCGGLGANLLTIIDAN